MVLPRNDAHLDEFHRDQQWHKPVRAATTANITISTALNAGDTVDGVTLAAGDRVLVKSQSSGLENGIYVAGATPTRAYDFVTGIQARGAFIYVIAGTANGGKLFYNTNTSLPTIDTDALTFVEFGQGIAGLSAIDFLVGTATGLLSGEIVAGTTPGGELGGTWASPTVDTTHSGSAHVTAHSGLTGLTSGDDHTQYVENADDVSVNIECDGGASTPSTGVKAYFQMPRSGHFRAAKIIAKDASSSAVFDVWVRSGNVPTVSQSVTASAKPTLTSAQLADPACTIASWSSTAFSANDWVGINLDSVTTATLLVLTLYIDWT